MVHNFFLVWQDGRINILEYCKEMLCFIYTYAYMFVCACLYTETCVCTHRHQSSLFGAYCRA